MSATPTDVARYTNDGVVLTTDAATGVAIRAAHTDAQTNSPGEIEMLFDSAAVGQLFLNEKFGYLSIINPPHVGVEVDDSLGIGSVIAIAPKVPCFTAVDEKSALNSLLRTRAFAHDSETDRYSVELRK